ncbi:unnamed protein product [Symbiodinium natans]|uniref:Uncharacterized protein n=1 Tax=Symbiodinium natans TaxID=878477 RepID=A0A812S923_9DINO|nr:unnamed protein product [Symbiodinium natans]
MPTLPSWLSNNANTNGALALVLTIIVRWFNSAHPAPKSAKEHSAHQPHKSAEEDSARPPPKSAKEESAHPPQKSAKEDLKDVALTMHDMRQNKSPPTSDVTFECLSGVKKFGATWTKTGPKYRMAESVELGLKAKNIPKEVVDAIKFHLVESSEVAYQESSSVASISAQGIAQASLYKVILMAKPSHKDPPEQQVALSVAGVSFDAAKTVVEYKEHEEPVLKPVTIKEPVNVAQGGLPGLVLGGKVEYKERTEYVKVDVRRWKEPVWDQQVFSATQIEQLFLQIEGELQQSIFQTLAIRPSVQPVPPYALQSKL